MIPLRHGLIYLTSDQYVVEANNLYVFETNKETKICLYLDLVDYLSIQKES